MKKMVRLIALLMLLATLLCGCGGKFTCDFCGEEKSGSKYSMDLMGEKIDICKDCKKGLDELSDLFG